MSAWTMRRRLHHNSSGINLRFRCQHSSSCAVEFTYTLSVVPTAQCSSYVGVDDEAQASSSFFRHHLTPPLATFFRSEERRVGNYLCCTNSAMLKLCRRGR